MLDKEDWADANWYEFDVGVAESPRQKNRFPGVCVSQIRDILRLRYWAALCINLIRNKLEVIRTHPARIDIFPPNNYAINIRWQKLLWDQFGTSLHTRATWANKQFFSAIQTKMRTMPTQHGPSLKLHPGMAASTPCDPPDVVTWWKYANFYA